jgi:hypothetical protein
MPWGLTLLLVAFFVALAVVWAIAYAFSRTAHRSMFEDSNDHELALSLARSRQRVAMAQRPAGGAGLHAVPAAQPGPRDPVIGLDAARAEVRERIHRYNSREVRR